MDEELLKIEASAVRPTQFVVGFREIEDRKRQLKRLSKDPNDLKDYLKKKAGAVVRAPDGNLYLIDGHHLAKAMVDLQLDAKMRVKVAADWSKLQANEPLPKRMQAFWQKMEAGKLVYTVDEHGKKHAAQDLAALTKIASLRDDPYRSLAWYVRDRGGFENLTMPFQEFLWADFFRSRIEFDDTSDADFERAVQLGVKIAKSKEAAQAGLPGYNGPAAAAGN